MDFGWKRGRYANITSFITVSTYINRAQIFSHPLAFFFPLKKSVYCVFHLRLPIDVEKWPGYIVGYFISYLAAYFVSLTTGLYTFFISVSLYVKAALDEIRFKLKTINQNPWVMNTLRALFQLNEPLFFPFPIFHFFSVFFFCVEKNEFSGEKLAMASIVMASKFNTNSLAQLSYI